MLIYAPEPTVNLMKFRLFPLASPLLVVVLLGCRPERLRTGPSHPRTVDFTQAGVTLTVGEEWQGQNLNLERYLYPPALVSRAGVIRVLLLPPDRSDPAVVADGLRAAFDLNPLVAKHSFRKQQFTSDKGARGFCVSYLQRADANRGETSVENSHYVVTNRAGRCVVINYMAAAADVDTSDIHQMLRTSLSLR